MSIGCSGNGQKDCCTDCSHADSTRGACPKGLRRGGPCVTSVFMLQHLVLPNSDCIRRGAVPLLILLSFAGCTESNGTESKDGTRTTTANSTGSVPVHV